MSCRILFMSEAMTLAHRVRPMVLAQELNLTAFEIGFAADTYFNSYFKPYPLDWRVFSIRSLAPRQMERRLRMGQRLFEGKELIHSVGEDLKIIELFKPDLIISDYRLSLHISAKLSKIPWISLANSYWFSEPLSGWEVPPIFLTKIFGTTIPTAIFHRFGPCFVKDHLKGLIEAESYFGCSPTESLSQTPFLLNDPQNLSINALSRFYQEGTHTLFCDPPSFVNPALLNPDRQVLGPLLWSPDIQPPDWYKEALQAPQGRRVYLNMGSSGIKSNVPQLISRLLKENFVVVAGGVSSDQLNPSKTLFAESLLPGDLMCEWADIVICNGGSPSVQQALAQGKPVLGITQNLDQILNMRTIVQKNLGLTIRSDQITPQRFFECAEKLVSDPEFGRKAQGVKAELQQRKTLSEISWIQNKIKPLKNAL